MLDCLKSALLAAGLTLTMATAPHAAVVSFDLDVSFLNGPLVGSPLDPFLLTISYDDDDLTYGDADDGDGSLSPQDGLGIVFNGVSVEDLDVDYPLFPRVGFLDYIPSSINYSVQHQFPDRLRHASRAVGPGTPVSVDRSRFRDGQSL